MAVVGTVPATTFIKNIRANLSENLAGDADLLDPNQGTNWTNSQILEYLNKAKDRTWDIVRNVREDYFLVTGATLSISASTKEYALASNFRQLVGIKVTTSGYEYISLRAIALNSREFKVRDAIPSGNSSNIDELVYTVVTTSTSGMVLKLADYPPTSLTLTYDYVQYLADFTLSASSVVNINDELREFIEAYATRLALAKIPSDTRIQFWDMEIKRLQEIVTASVSDRQIRDPEFVDDYDPLG